MDASWNIVVREKKIIRNKMTGKCAEGFAGDKGQKMATEGSG